MDDQVIFLPKKNAKSKKLYGCSKCSYQTTRAYNVHRHLTRHFKAPKELQHICPVASCSFTTLRWDNLNRHTARVHRPREEAPPAVDKEFSPTNEVELDTMSTYENPEFLQIDNDPASTLSDEELASLICEEISGESQNGELPKTEDIQKPVEPDKRANEVKRKPRYIFNKSAVYYFTNVIFSIEKAIRVAKQYFMSASNAIIVRIALLTLNDIWPSIRPRGNTQQSCSITFV